MSYRCKAAQPLLKSISTAADELASTLRVSRPLIPIGLLLMGVVHFITCLLTQYWPVSWELTNAEGYAIGRDFLLFWTASSLAQRGDLATIFDPLALTAATDQVIATDAGVLPWLYPPVFLLYVLPLALIPYVPSLLLWFAAPLRLLMTALRRQIPSQLSPWLILCFPGIAQCVVYGQNGILSTLFLACGLGMLDRRPILAGAVLGLLCYKPQLCILYIPILVFGGYWRSVMSMAAVAIALTLVTIAVFGIESWQMFLQTLPLAGLILERGEALWPLMVTVYAAARQIGVGHFTALILQGTCALLAVIAVCFLWRRRAPLALKTGAAVTASTLATPYALNYDLAMLVLPIGWVVADLGRRNWLPGEKLLLGFVWTLPAWGWSVAEHTGLLVTPLFTAALLIAIIRRAMRLSPTDVERIPAPGQLGLQGAR